MPADLDLAFIRHLPRTSKWIPPFMGASRSLIYVPGLSATLVLEPGPFFFQKWFLGTLELSMDGMRSCPALLDSIRLVLLFLREVSQSQINTFIRLFLTVRMDHWTKRSYTRTTLFDLCFWWSSRNRMEVVEFCGILGLLQVCCLSENLESSMSFYCVKCQAPIYNTVSHLFVQIKSNIPLLFDFRKVDTSVWRSVGIILGLVGRD